MAADPLARVLLFTAAATIALAACSQEPAPPAAEETVASATSVAPSPERTMPYTDAGSIFPSGAWDMISSGEGEGLLFGVTEGEPATIHLFCASGTDTLLVNVNAFRSVASEERMTIGSGGTAATLVADPAGDRNRGGVSGEGPVPANLDALLAARTGFGVNYGAQDVGPLPPVPAETARDFAAGCAD